MIVTDSLMLKPIPARYLSQDAHLLWSAGVNARPAQEAAGTRHLGDGVTVSDVRLPEGSLMVLPKHGGHENKFKWKFNVEICWEFHGYWQILI